MELDDPATPVGVLAVFQNYFANVFKKDIFQFEGGNNIP